MILRTRRLAARYAFLHEGVLFGFLSQLGRQAKDAAIYWKYGCWFYEQTTRSQVLIESRWEDAASEAGAGKSSFAHGASAINDLIEQLLWTLQTLWVGQPPEIKRTYNATVAINAGAGVLSRVINVQMALVVSGPPDLVRPIRHGRDDDLISCCLLILSLKVTSLPTVTPFHGASALQLVDFGVPTHLAQHP